MKLLPLYITIMFIAIVIPGNSYAITEKELLEKRRNLLDIVEKNIRSIDNQRIKLKAKEQGEIVEGLTRNFFNAMEKVTPTGSSVIKKLTKRFGTPSRPIFDVWSQKAGDVWRNIAEKQMRKAVDDSRRIYMAALRSEEFVPPQSWSVNNQKTSESSDGLVDRAAELEGVSKFYNQSPAGFMRPPDREKMAYDPPVSDFDTFTNQVPEGLGDPPDRRNLAYDPPKSDIETFSNQAPAGLMARTDGNTVVRPAHGLTDQRMRTSIHSTAARTSKSKPSPSSDSSLLDNQLLQSPEAGSSCVDMYGRTVVYSGGGIKPCLKRLETTEDGHVLHLQFNPGETRAIELRKGTSPEAICEAMLPGPDRDNCMKYVQRVKQDMPPPAASGGSTTGNPVSDTGRDAPAGNEGPSRLSSEFPQCDPDLTNEALSRSGGIEHCIRQQKALEKQLEVGLGHYPECGPAPELPEIPNQSRQHKSGDFVSNDKALENIEPDRSNDAALVANKLKRFKQRRREIKQCLDQHIAVCEREKSRKEMEQDNWLEPPTGNARSRYDRCISSSDYARQYANLGPGFCKAASTGQIQKFYSQFTGPCGKAPGLGNNEAVFAHERCMDSHLAQQRHAGEEDGEQCPRLPTDEEALKGFDTSAYQAPAGAAQSPRTIAPANGTGPEQTGLQLPDNAPQQNWIDPKVADKMFDSLLPQ